MGKLQVCTDGMVLAWRSWKPATWNRGILCSWLGVHIWLSLIGPKLEVGTKIRDAISNQVLVWGQLLWKLFSFSDCY